MHQKSFRIVLVSMALLAACGRDPSRPIAVGERPSAGGHGGAGDPIAGTGLDNPEAGVAGSAGIGSLTSELGVDIKTPSGITLEIVTLACEGDCADIEAVARGGNAPYAYEWEDGSTDAKRRVCLDADAELRVDARDTAFDLDEFRYDGQRASARVNADVIDCTDPLAPVESDCGPVDPDNLIVNGGFECPVVDPGSFMPFESGAAFDGWRVIGEPGNVGPLSGTYIGISSTGTVVTFTPRSGEQTLDLTGTSTSATGVEQTLSTEPGESYEISFWIGNAGDAAWGLESSVDVWVDGAPLCARTNAEAAPPSIVWTQARCDFTAKQTSTRITFVNADQIIDASNLLDDVAVTRIDDR